MTACFLFMTKMMPRAPVRTEEQRPILLTTRYELRNKKQRYQPSRCFLHSGIKTLFMKDVNLKSNNQYFDKKGKTFLCGSAYVSGLHHFLKRWRCLHRECWLMWSCSGWSTVGAVRAGERGAPVPRVQVAPAMSHHCSPSAAGCRY